MTAEIHQESDHVTWGDRNQGADSMKKGTAIGLMMLVGFLCFVAGSIIAHYQESKFWIQEIRKGKEWLDKTIQDELEVLIETNYEAACAIEDFFSQVKKTEGLNSYRLPKED